MTRYLVNRYSEHLCEGIFECGPQGLLLDLHSEITLVAVRGLFRMLGIKVRLATCKAIALLSVLGLFSHTIVRFYIKHIALHNANWPHSIS